MKKLIFVLLFMASAVVAKAQNDAEEKQAVQMLKEFYIAYNAAWSTAHHGIPIKKLDSLQRKYCTKKMRDEVKEFGLDHDSVIGVDNLYAEHLKTVTVIKDSAKTNAYMVSYSYHTTFGSQSTDTKVVLHVTFVKEGVNFKIDSVIEQGI